MGVNEFLTPKKDSLDLKNLPIKNTRILSIT